MKKVIPVFMAVIILFSFPMTVNASTGEIDGGFLGGLFDGLLDGIIEGLKDLFIPSDDFFASFNGDISQAIDRKTGGLVFSFKAVTDEFNQLQSGGQTNNTLKLTMPDNILYSGYKGTSVNLLGGIGDFATWFRGLFSAFMVVSTIILCYRKVVALFKG